MEFLADDLPLVVRLANDNDYGHVLSTWTNHYHKTIPATFVPKDIFLPFQRNVINSILSQATCHVICLDEEPDLIIGYLVHQNINIPNAHIIHWANVKSNHRNQGYMRLLFEKLELTGKTLICSHFFKQFPEMKDKHKLIYDPTIVHQMVGKELP